RRPAGRFPRAASPRRPALRPGRSLLPLLLPGPAARPPALQRNAARLLALPVRLWPARPAGRLALPGARRRRRARQRRFLGIHPRALRPDPGSPRDYRGEQPLLGRSLGTLSGAEWSAPVLRGRLRGLPESLLELAPIRCGPPPRPRAPRPA